MSPRIVVINPKTSHPGHKKIPNGINKNKNPQLVKRAALRPNREYTTWPPSSCPMGRRFIEVTNSPNHAAKAVGWRMISMLHEKCPKRSRQRSSRMIDEPRDRPSVAPLGGLASDNNNPTINNGMAKTAPLMGPKAPISTSAVLFGMGERILINAPNVPSGGIAGMKYGGVTSRPRRRAVR